VPRLWPAAGGSRLRSRTNVGSSLVPSTRAQLRGDAPGGSGSPVGTGPGSGPVSVAELGSDRLVLPQGSPAFLLPLSPANPYRALPPDNRRAGTDREPSRGRRASDPPVHRARSAHPFSSPPEVRCPSPIPHSSPSGRNSPGNPGRGSPRRPAPRVSPAALSLPAATQAPAARAPPCPMAVLPDPAARVRPCPPVVRAVPCLPAAPTATPPVVPFPPVVVAAAGT